MHQHVFMVCVWNALAKLSLQYLMNQSLSTRMLANREGNKLLEAWNNESDKRKLCWQTITTHKICDLLEVISHSWLPGPKQIIELTTGLLGAYIYSIDSNLRYSRNQGKTKLKT